ncbi:MULTISPECIES: DUF6325 family protein [Gordonia]|uniref:DUF6325 family protein n=1 Tax=Gordonia amicalis TaxID=89053 RepID=A0AAE4UBF9_9ACTN|nr:MULTISPECIES: DUF6325 family protein [Gordonia]ATD71332.1 DUF1269 domain-containing family protein [Gordonia sp. 1D]MCZ0912644.1 DUF6325 family protein [Gordonia amicalis]MCZ4580624.1 DUF6325 family protein [Gordonia amicalis]MDV6313322.1 DUF6325 family protein [Gordonia amicalis]
MTAAADRDQAPDRELGPVDYVVVEWAGREPTGEALPYLMDLIDRGIVRLIDIVFLTKGADGAVAEVEIGELGMEFAIFDGAATSILDDTDIAEAATAIEPGSSAAVLVWENLWAAPFATALRNNGGRVVASGRIPVDALLESLGAIERS